MGLRREDDVRVVTGLPLNEGSMHDHRLSPRGRRLRRDGDRSACIADHLRSRSSGRSLALCVLADASVAQAWEIQQLEIGRLPNIGRRP